MGVHLQHGVHLQLSPVNLAQKCSQPWGCTCTQCIPGYAYDKSWMAGVYLPMRILCYRDIALMRRDATLSEIVCVAVKSDESRRGHFETVSSGRRRATVAGGTLDFGRQRRSSSVSHSR